MGRKDHFSVWRFTGGSWFDLVDVEFAAERPAQNAILGRLVRLQRVRKLPKLVREIFPLRDRLTRTRLMDDSVQSTQ